MWCSIGALLRHRPHVRILALLIAFAIVGGHFVVADSEDLIFDEGTSLPYTHAAVEYWHEPSGYGTFTITAWVNYPSSGPADASFVNRLGTYAGWQMEIRSNTLRCRWGNGIATSNYGYGQVQGGSTAAVPRDEWVKVQCVRTASGTLEARQDDVVVASCTGCMRNYVEAPASTQIVVGVAGFAGTIKGVTVGGGKWGVPDRQVQNVQVSCAAATRLDVTFMGLGFPQFRVVAQQNGCAFPWTTCGSIIDTLYSYDEICEQYACAISVDLPSAGITYDKVSVQGVESGVMESGYWDSNVGEVACPAFGSISFKCPRSTSVTVSWLMLSGDMSHLAKYRVYIDGSRDFYSSPVTWEEACDEAGNCQITIHDVNEAGYKFKHVDVQGLDASGNVLTSQGREQEACEAIPDLRATCADDGQKRILQWTAMTNDNTYVFTPHYDNELDVDGLEGTPFYRGGVEVPSANVCEPAVDGDYAFYKCTAEVGAWEDDDLRIIRKGHSRYPIAPTNCASNSEGAQLGAVTLGCGTAPGTVVVAATLLGDAVDSTTELRLDIAPADCDSHACGMIQSGWFVRSMVCNDNRRCEFTLPATLGGRNVVYSWATMFLRFGSDGVQAQTGLFEAAGELPFNCPDVTDVAVSCVGGGGVLALSFRADLNLFDSFQVRMATENCLVPVESDSELSTLGWDEHAYELEDGCVVQTFDVAADSCDDGACAARLTLPSADTTWERVSIQGVASGVRPEPVAMGCYSDQKDYLKKICKACRTQALSVVHCANACRKEGYHYSFLKASVGKCRCANKYGKERFQCDYDNNVLYSATKVERSATPDPLYWADMAKNVFCPTLPLQAQYLLREGYVEGALMDSTDEYVSTNEFAATLTTFDSTGDVVAGATVRLSLDFADTALTSATVQYYTEDAVVAVTFEVSASRRRAIADADLRRFSRRDVPRQPRTAGDALVAGTDFLELAADATGRLEVTIVAADVAAPVLLVDTTGWWDGIGYEVMRLHVDDQVNSEMSGVTGDDITGGKNGGPLQDNLSSSDANVMATTISGIAGAITPAGTSGSDPTLRRRDVEHPDAPVFRRPLGRNTGVHLHLSLGRHGGGDPNEGLRATRGSAAADVMAAFVLDVRARQAASLEAMLAVVPEEEVRSVRGSLALSRRRLRDVQRVRKRRQHVRRRSLSVGRRVRRRLSDAVPEELDLVRGIERRRRGWGKSMKKAVKNASKAAANAADQAAKAAKAAADAADRLREQAAAAAAQVAAAAQAAAEAAAARLRAATAAAIAAARQLKEDAQESALAAAKSAAGAYKDAVSVAKSAQSAYNSMKSDIKAGVAELKSTDLGLKELGRAITTAVSDGIAFVREGAAVIEDVALVAIHEAMHDAVLLVTDPVGFAERMYMAAQMVVSLLPPPADNVLLCVMDRVVNGLITAVLATVRFVSQAVDMIVSLCNAIGAFVARIVAFLSMLFNWDDILYTQRSVRGYIKSFFAYSSNILGKAELGEQMRCSMELVAETLGPVGDDLNFDALQPLLDVADAMSSAMGFVMNLLMKGLSKIMSIVSGAMSSFLSGMGVDDLVADLGIDFTVIARIGGYLATGRLDDMFADMGDEIVDFIAVVADGGRAVAKLFFDAVADALTAEISIPIVSWVFEWLTGSKFTILNAFSLALAFPITISYKLVMFKAPFSSSEANTADELGGTEQFFVQLLGADSSDTIAGNIASGCGSRRDRSADEDVSRDALRRDRRVAKALRYEKYDMANAVGQLIGALFDYGADIVGSSDDVGGETATNVLQAFSWVFQTPVQIFVRWNKFPEYERALEIVTWGVNLVQLVAVTGAIAVSYSSGGQTANCVGCDTIRLATAVITTLIDVAMFITHVAEKRGLKNCVLAGLAALDAVLNTALAIYDFKTSRRRRGNGEEELNPGDDPFALITRNSNESSGNGLIPRGEGGSAVSHSRRGSPLTLLIGPAAALTFAFSLIFAIMSDAATKIFALRLLTLLGAGVTYIVWVALRMSTTGHA